ncbi:MAG: hypothetical protein Kow0027_10020 [Saprospiraceae bacterium]|nr:peptidase S24 [Saprospirales bacterium]RME06569.1 MAG: peptidase S24 [Bacteroidota bacterium]
MNSIVSQRFIQCHDKIRELGKVKSSRQFALSLDYLPQSLSEILKGRRDVTIELIRKAVDKYGINPIFLFTGEGPMFLTEEGSGGIRLLTVVTDNTGEEKILHVPVPAQAGYASEQLDPAFYEELPAYTLPDYKYRVGTHRSFDVAGDSMEPTLFEGDKVVCSFVEREHWASNVKDNYVYVIVTKGDVLVKRVFNKINESRTLELHSDNNFYEPYEVPVHSIKEIWYVRAKISPFLPSPSNIENFVREEVRELKQIIQQQSRLINNLYQTIDKMIGQKT